MKAVHSWMEYQYKFANANDNCKMWMRNKQRIHLTSTGTYSIADDSGWYDGTYNTFEEAEKAFDNDNTVNIQA